MLKFDESVAADAGRRMVIVSSHTSSPFDSYSLYEFLGSYVYILWNFLQMSRLHIRISCRGKQIDRREGNFHTSTFEDKNC